MYLKFEKVATRQFTIRNMFDMNSFSNTCDAQPSCVVVECNLEPARNWPETGQNAVQLIA